jgi:hypothetical protein
MPFDLIRDPGFCVRSSPEFLLLVGKICLKQRIFVDLAVQSLFEYLQYLQYNKNFVEAWQMKSVVAGLMIASVITRVCSSSSKAENKLLVQQVASEVNAVIKN